MVSLASSVGSRVLSKSRKVDGGSEGKLPCPPGVPGAISIIFEKAEKDEWPKDVRKGVTFRSGEVTRTFQPVSLQKIYQHEKQVVKGLR